MSRRVALLLSLLVAILISPGCHKKKGGDGGSPLPPCTSDFFLDLEWAQYPGINDSPDNFLIPHQQLFIRGLFGEVLFPFTGQAVDSMGNKSNFTSNDGRFAFPVYKGGRWAFFGVPFGYACTPSANVIQGTPWNVRMSLNKRNHHPEDPPFQFGIRDNQSGNLIPSGFGIEASYVMVYREVNQFFVQLENLFPIYFNGGQTVVNYQPTSQVGTLVVVGVDPDGRITEAQRLRILNPFGDAGVEFNDVTATAGTSVPFTFRVTNPAALQTLKLTFRYVGPTFVAGLPPVEFEILNTIPPFANWPAGSHPDRQHPLKGLWSIEVDAQFTTGTSLSTYPLWVK